MTSHNKKCVDIKKDGIKALKLDWNKIDKVQYQQEIGYSPSHIDMAYTEVNTMIHNTITTVAPRKKSTKRKHKLKVMNEEINKAIKAKKQSYCIWKWNGRPEDPQNELVVNKKLTTQQLRKICRMEIARRRISEREELIGARIMDNALFHKPLCQLRGKLNRFIDKLNVGDTIYRSENSLCGWREHFAALAKESVQDTFDQNYSMQRNLNLNKFRKICQHEFSHEDITIEELDKAILRLNRGKSGDIFGVTAEYIVYGGDKLKNLLLKLINHRFEHYSVPELLKVGTLPPIYKNKGLMTE